VTVDLDVEDPAAVVETHRKVEVVVAGWRFTLRVRIGAPPPTPEEATVIAAAIVLGLSGGGERDD